MDKEKMKDLRDKDPTLILAFLSGMIVSSVVIIIQALLGAIPCHLQH